MYFVSAGTSRAARMAKMTRTTMSSTRVKPFLFYILRIFSNIINSSTKFYKDFVRPYL